MAQDTVGEALVVGVPSGNALDVQFADGSTYTVRLIGVNAPRIDAPGIGTECYGLEARDFLKGLITGQTVRLEREVSEKNQTGRLLRHVWLRDPGSGSETHLGAILTSEGITEAQPLPPDTRMAEELRALEVEARASKKGRWAACPET
jgi:endonuclease YncB( thermonuclease family)